MWMRQGKYLRFALRFIRVTGRNMIMACPYFVTLLAWTARSARSNVSRPNCSTYACPAVSSIMASSSAYLLFVCHSLLAFVD